MTNIFANPLFITILAAGLGAQLVKIVVFYFKTGRVHLLDLIATGGMPSSHSALTSALTTAIYLSEGATTAFFISFAVACVIVVDSFGVRRTVGEEGQILHQLIRKTKLTIKEPHYSLGHTPAEVLVGLLFGIVVAVGVSLI